MRLARRPTPAACGTQVTLTDLKSTDELRQGIQQLADLHRIRYHLGGHDERDFVETDLRVVNPPFPAIARICSRAWRGRP